MNQDRFQNSSDDDGRLCSEFDPVVVEPIAITLRNVYIPQMYFKSEPKQVDRILSMDQDQSSSSVEEEDEKFNTNKIHRWTSCHPPLHKSVLPLKMEVVVPYANMKIIKQSYKDILDDPKFTKMFGLKNKFSRQKLQHHNEEEEDVIILCSKIIQQPSSHLQWNHFKENLDDIYASIPFISTSEVDANLKARKQLWNELQSFMKIRCRAFFIPTPHSLDSSNPGDLQEHYENHAEQPLKSFTLACAELDPIHLAALPPSNTNVMNTFVVTQSTFSKYIPSSLPSNTMLIHFSDGSTRILLSLYEILIKKRIIDVEVKAPIYNGKRFEDKDFDILGEQGEYTRVKLKVDELSVNASTNGIGSPRMKDMQDGNGMNYKNGNRGAFTDVFESVSSSAKTSRHSSIHGNYVNSILFTDDDKSDSSSVSSDSMASHMQDVVDNNNDGYEMDDKQAQYLDYDIIILKRELQQEKDHLKDELNQQKRLTSNLGDLTNKIDETERGLISIREDSKISFNHCIHLNFILQKRKKKLLQDLSKIYPIQTLPDSVYSIRGIHLPNDMHSLVASEEVISAGLGFVCHVVVMCSKYLEVPLRYRLICNSSRSAIRDDNFDVYPLFKERVIEKEQFDRAIILLHRNIDHILDSRNVPINIRSEQSHILSKLQLIFE